MTNVDPALLAQFPYLEITEADLRAVLEADPVTQKGIAAIKDFETKIADYEQRRAGFRTELDKNADKRSELEAQLKALDTERRELQGADAGMNYHVKLARRRIAEREAALNKRQKFLFRAEVNRRLAKMGREFKLNAGTRAARGLGAGVVPLDR